MKLLRKKLLRIERVRSIEQGVLDRLSTQILVLQMHIHSLIARRDQLREQTDKLQAMERLPSVEQLCHSAAWLENIRAQTDELEMHIAEAERQQEALYQRVAEQKSKVRGWDVLIEQIQSRITLETHNREGLAASDRYLHTRQGN